ncbi:MAG: alpha/beta hydrolase [Saprospiraceae bacterium]
MNTLLLTVFMLLLLIAGILVFVYASPTLSKEALAAIKNIREKPLPELVKGKTGYAQSGDIKIWYEVINPIAQPRGTILLVMGHGTSAVRWPPYFYQPMIDAGYQIIRYDNRGLGKSDWIAHWTKKNAYTLVDMAADGLAVLDTLGIQQVHLLGVSMGGMIAQQMAIDYASRIISLTSIMSSGHMYDPELPFVPRKTFLAAAKLDIRYRLQPNEESFLKYAVNATHVLKGKDPAPVNLSFSIISNLYLWRKHGGYNAKVGQQHTHAIKAGGSRYAGLKKLQIPTLVIHGTADPLVPVAHSKKYGPMIPNAQVEIIDKMGHRLSEYYMPQILSFILQHFGKG